MKYPTSLYIEGWQWMLRLSCSSVRNVMSEGTQVSRSEMFWDTAWRRPFWESRLCLLWVFCQFAYTHCEGLMPPPTAAANETLTNQTRCVNPWPDRKKHLCIIIRHHMLRACFAKKNKYSIRGLDNHDIHRYIDIGNISPDRIPYISNPDHIFSVSMICHVENRYTNGGQWYTSNWCYDSALESVLVKSMGAKWVTHVKEDPTHSTHLNTIIHRCLYLCISAFMRSDYHQNNLIFIMGYSRSPLILIFRDPTSLFSYNAKKTPTIIITTIIVIIITIITIIIITIIIIIFIISHAAHQCQALQHKPFHPSGLSQFRKSALPPCFCFVFLFCFFLPPCFHVFSKKKITIPKPLESDVSMLAPQFSPRVSHLTKV